jgi:hypothetical protein
VITGRIVYGERMSHLQKNRCGVRGHRCGQRVVPHWRIVLGHAGRCAWLSDIRSSKRRGWSGWVPVSPAPTAFVMQRHILFLMTRNNSHILQLFFSSGELLVDVFLQKCLLVYMAVDIFSVVRLMDVLIRSVEMGLVILILVCE